MTDKPLSHQQLQQHFAAERARVITPSDNTMAVVLKNAHAFCPMKKPAPKPALGRRMAWVFGSVFSPVAASAICAVFGVYLGYSAPILDDFVQQQTIEITIWSDADVFEYLPQE